jgi:hypothetical protein
MLDVETAAPGCPFERSSKLLASAISGFWVAQRFSAAIRVRYVLRLQPLRGYSVPGTRDSPLCFPDSPPTAFFGAGFFAASARFRS